MDIKKLELFADVAETRNFTRSGDRWATPSPA